MGNQFIIKGLVESKEIQSSYDEGNYYDAVMKCRIYLEGWLSEYIYAILYPVDVDPKADNRQFVSDNFDNMHVKINWLKRQKHISENDFDNLNKIRVFCNDVFSKGDVFKMVTQDKLDQYIEASVHYCARIKKATRMLIEGSSAPKKE